MKLIPHRGYKTQNIKENTHDAFLNALNCGFTGIEFDVRKTRLGELVICHDALITRVSDGDGFVKDYSYEELLRFTFGSEVLPSKIPLLIDVLKKYTCIKVVELKERDIDFSSFEDYIDDKTYFISFDSNYIFELKNKYPQYKFGVLNYVLNSVEDYSLDCICLLDMVVTERMVDYFINRDITVFIYGIGSKVNYITDKEGVYYIVDKNINT